MLACSSSYEEKRKTPPQNAHTDSLHNLNFPFHNAHFPRNWRLQGCAVSNFSVNDNNTSENDLVFVLWMDAGRTVAQVWRSEAVRCHRGTVCTLCSSQLGHKFEENDS